MLINPSHIFLLNILISFLLTIISIPFIKKIGLKYNLLDKNDKRKKNFSSLVRIGGISIFLTYFLALISNILFLRNDFEIELFSDNLIFKLFSGSFLIFLLGLADDIKQINPKFRLIIQFIIAGAMWIWGFQINNIYFGEILNLRFFIELPLLLSFVLTTFWIVGIINAINWMDGLDGLASSLCLIFFTSFLGTGFFFSNLSSVLISSIFVGASLGFLYFNFNPAKILMGDCGSYLLGFNLSLISISANSNNINDLYSLHFYYPLIIISYPILDMIRVILKRLINKKSPFFPDRNHYHYVLIDKGITQRKTVFLIIALSIITNSIVLISIDNFNLFFIFLFLIFFYFFKSRVISNESF